MHDTPQDPAPAGSARALPEAEDLVKAISLLANNTLQHKWLSKTDAQDTLAYCFSLLDSALKSCEQVNFRIGGGQLHVNEAPVDSKSGAVLAFMQQLKSLRIDNFSLRKGIDQTMLGNLLEVLTARPDQIEQLGGFSSAVAACGLTNVTSKTIVYREVTEEDVVVSRAEFEKAREDLDKTRDVRDRVANIGDVLAFLQKSDLGEKSAEVVQEVQGMASDARRLAEMIMQAAEAQKDAAEDGARENVASAIVGCVRRAFDTMLNDPAMKTQKGKKQLQRNLRTLEQELLGLLPDLAAEQKESCRTAITEALDEMKDEVQIDSIAAEYMKKLKAMEKAQKRLVRYINAKGQEGLEESELRARLAAEGISIDEWQDLVLKTDVGLPGLPGGLGFGPRGEDGAPAGPGGGAAGTGGGGHAIEHLADLLTRMERVVNEIARSPSPGQRQEFTGVLTEVNAELGRMVEATTRRVRSVAREIRADASAVEASEELARKQGLGLRMTRRQILELLAEIVQELFQPLAVIRCSLEMIASRRLGDVAQPQVEVLLLADESATKLKSLVDSLLEISGFPQTMAPDRQLLAKAHGG